ncbi:hypothetical protein ACLOJK_029192 [Asimina triloba]
MGVFGDHSLGGSVRGLKQGRGRAKGFARAMLCRRHDREVELQEMGQRANHSAALGGGYAKALRQDLYATRLKQEHLKEDIVGEEASGLSAELATARSEDEALRARNVDSNVNGAESCANLEVARGEISLLHGQIALLGLREEELLSESEAARAEVARLRAELEVSQAEVALL